MPRPEVGVTFPRGFMATGLHCGIRKQRPDLALLYSEVPATAAGVFTTNRFRAACVEVTGQVIRSGSVQAVLVNSGNANAGTGARGMQDCLQSQRAVAECLDLAPCAVAVASTGVIGVPLPMDRLLEGIGRLPAGLSKEGGLAFADAILTTDTCRKESAATFEVDVQTFRVGGTAKGSGMIHPNMATMLAFLTTDARVAAAALCQAMKRACDRTFNRISVDGDTSTNDMAIVLANGAAGGPLLDVDHPAFPAFAEALEAVARDLAKQIARDGEGATHLLEVRVSGAASEADAGKVARAVVSSNLVKAAIFGKDANWGRFLAAAGAAGVPFDPERASLAVGPVTIVTNGVPAPVQDQVEEALARYLEEDTIQVHLSLGSGDAEATAWGCDLTYDYVRINAAYRT